MPTPLDDEHSRSNDTSGPSVRAPAPPTRLLVVRHGQSEWNALRRWQGQADPPLSEEGMLQAADAGLRLGTFDAIWSSDLQRASLTADIIAEIIGIGPVQLDARLRETDVGPWQGLTHDEIEEQYPGFLADRRRPDGFETDDMISARVLPALLDIGAASPGGEVLVISHAGIIRSVRRLLGASDEPMGNLSGAWFEVRGGSIFARELVNLVGTEPTGMVL
jgi:broad specificity phosphatase PhoE